MSETTNLKLFKHDNPSTNTGLFDIDKSLNQNWDKIDENAGDTNSLLEEVNNNLNHEINTRQNADSNLQTQINSLASGSPKGNYPTLSELTSNNPDTGVYIVQADGHIYSWTKDGTNAIDLGIYQATDVANNSINIEKLSYDFKEDSNNFLNVALIEENKTISISPNSTINSQGSSNSNFNLYPPIAVIPEGQYAPLDTSGNIPSILNFTFYDNTGEFIEYTTTEANVPIQIPQNCYYIRFSHRNNKAPIIQFKRYDVENYTTEYETYKYNSKIALLEDLEEINNNIENLSNKTNANTNFNNSFKKLSFELIDNSYINKSGELISDQWSSNIKSTNFVRVKSGYTVSFINVATNSNTSICGYDSNQEFVELLSNGGTTHDNIDILIPDNVKYVRASCINNYANSFDIYYKDIANDLIYSNKIEEITDININNILNNSGKTPLITWVDDDCDYDGIATVKNICDNLNIKCTFACVTSGISSSNTDISNSGLNNEDLKNRLLDYQSNGFHITTHSNHHANIWKSSDELYNPSECEKDLIKSIQMLQENGFLESDFLITPFGTHTTPIQNIAEKWCKCLISSGGGANHLNDDGKYYIHRIFITKEHDLDYYKNIIDNALTNKDWIIFGTHSGTSSEFDTTLVTNVLNYAISQNIDIKPLNSAWKQRKIVYDFFDLFN